MLHFADLLGEAFERTGSPVCVGLDPVVDRLPAALTRAGARPAQAVGEFCRGVVHAVAPSVGVVKFQSACFERFGSEGVAVLERAVRQARDAGMVVVLDAKRGDIGFSNEHYAAAVAALGAHAVTVHGYLGLATIEPFLAAGLGVFVLVRTSNPDGDAVQGQRLADGRTVAEMMADSVASAGATRVGEAGYSDVGAVVGATKAAEGRSLRTRMPRQVFLVPGYGAQGGTAEDVRALLDDRGGGVLVTASRSVIYPPSAGGARWEDAVAAAAARFGAEVAGAVSGPK